MSGAAITAFSSACSLFTMSAGVPAGARMIDQFDASKPGTVSAIGGTSGVSASRSADDTPSAFSVAVLHQRQRRGRRREHQRHASGDDIDDRRRGAVVGNVPSSVPVIILNSSANRCCDVATPGDAYSSSPGFSLAQLDQLRHRVRRQRCGRHQQKRILRHQRDRREILVRIEWRVLVERAGDRKRAAAQHQRVAVRRRISRAP